MASSRKPLSGMRTWGWSEIDLFKKMEYLNLLLFFNLDNNLKMEKN